MGMLIRGGTLQTAEGAFPGDLYIEGEQIRAVGRDLTVPAKTQVWNAEGCLVMPGFIDAHTHLDMPYAGGGTIDDFESGTRGAVAGGTTSIVDFATQFPGESLKDAARRWHEKAAGRSIADYGFHLIITDLRPEVEEEMASVAEEGITSFKLFMAYKGTLMVEDDVLFRALRRSKQLGTLVAVHAENGDVIDLLVREALERGDTAPRFHALTRPPEVEAEATGRALHLAQLAGAPILLVHVSAAASLERIRQARTAGQTVFAETCPQYLTLTEEDLERPEGERYVCSPPLRTAADQEHLWQGLQMGHLDLFSSDHCSFSLDQKKAPDFSRVPNGVPTIEHRPMALWHYGVRQGRITPEQFVSLVSTGPARIYGMFPRKGSLLPGADGDVVVWDPERSLQVSASSQHIRCDYALFDGEIFTGAPRWVFSRGELVFSEGTVLGKAGWGKYLPRERWGGKVWRWRNHC